MIGKRGRRKSSQRPPACEALIANSDSSSESEIGIVAVSTTKQQQNTPFQPNRARTIGGRAGDRQRRRDLGTPQATPAASMPMAVASQAATPADRQGLAMRFLDSIASVQKPSARPWPRWFVVVTWLLILMPVYAIIIYGVGFLYFWGQNPNTASSLPDNALMTVSGVLVPDHEGVFLQTTLTGKPALGEIDQYNSNALQPPEKDQVVLAPSQLQYIIVRQAQVDRPQNYQVFNLTVNGEKPVSTNNFHVTAPGYAVVAIAMPKGQTWTPGSYMVVVPEAGLDIEDLWCYFTVK
jgi:hypothetical protein